MWFRCCMEPTVPRRHKTTFPKARMNKKISWIFTLNVSYRKQKTLQVRKTENSCFSLYFGTYWQQNIPLKGWSHWIFHLDWLEKAMEDCKEYSSLGFSKLLCYLQQFEKIQRSNQSPKELSYASYLDLLSMNCEEAQLKISMYILLESSC